MSLPDWLIEDDEEGCVSCEGAVWPGERYCSNCKADLQDLRAEMHYRDASERRTA